MVHNLSNLTIYWGLSSKKEKLKKKKIWTKIWKKKIYIYNKTTTGWTVAWFLRLSTLLNTTQFSTFYYFLLLYYFSSLEIYYLLLIFNYFFLFILNHTRLLFPQFLHFILSNFITSSSTLLHLHFALLLVRNFYIFYQYQCGSVSSQVLSFKFLNMIFFSCIGTFVHFFSFQFFFSFWGFSVYKMQIFFGFKNFFFFLRHKLHVSQILNFGRYLPKQLK